MKENEAVNPVGVSVFSPKGIMFDPQSVTNQIQVLWEL